MIVGRLTIIGEVIDNIVVVQPIISIIILALCNLKISPSCNLTHGVNYVAIRITRLLSALYIPIIETKIILNLEVGKTYNLLGQ